MGQVTEVPLNSGQDQSTDRILLGTDKLALAQNCRLARDGRLEVRPSFTALTATTLASGSPPLVAFDVANYRNKLVALGDNTGSGRITDLFEFTGVLGWRGTAGAVAAARIPQFTDVRQIGGIPDQASAARNVSIAAGGGRICIVTNVRIGASSVEGEFGTTIHVLDPTTDQTIFFQSVAALRMARAVFCNGAFHIFGMNNTDDIVSYSVLTQLTGPTARVNLSGDMRDLALGTFGTGVALAYSETGGATTAFTYNSALTQTGTWVVDAADSNAIAVVGDAAGTLLSVVRLDRTTDQTTIETFNAAGTTQSGPTTLFGGATAAAPLLGACLVGTSVFCAVAGIGTAAADTIVQRAAQSGHALTGLQTYFSSRLECAPIAIGTQVFFGVNDQATAKGGITFHMLDEAQLIPQIYVQFAAGVVASQNATHTPAIIGTAIYFATTQLSEDTGNSVDSRRAIVFEAQTANTSRRQTAQLGGELLIAGGVPLAYDGRVVAEQGFAERPSSFAALAAQGTGGALTLLGVYTGIPVWEVFDGRGRILRSQAGSPQKVTLTGSNNKITWTLTTPHSLRRNPAYSGQGLSVRVRLYRTEAGEGVFFLDGETTIPITDRPAQNVALNSVQSDANLIDNIVLYEQSQTPVSHVSPPPYRYVHAARERPFAAGLPETEAYVYGKLLFPGEPVEWASLNRLGFSGRVNQPITAVAAFETTGLVWTAQEVWQIPGRGPEHDGTGEFDAAAAVASPGGCSDWRSIIVAPPGAFFQMRPDMLMLLTRGGDVQWIGLPIQDTLALFPTIVGAVFVRALDQVVFACNNLAGTDAVFLVYDLIKQQWFVDTVSTAVRSVSELDGRLVYIDSAGLVFQQDAAIASGVGALPTMSVRMGSLRPFTALGYGDIVKLGLLATYLGDCTVEVFISYDDGQNWTSLGAQAVTAAAWTNPISGAAIASGDPVTLIYTPAIRTVDRFALRVDVSNSVNTGGLRLHVLSFEVEAQEGTARKPARDQR